MMTLQTLADLTDGVLQGRNVSFDGVQIDSRRMQPGELFVAVRGERLDGHDFVADAGNREAAAALVSQPAGTMVPEVRVADTTIALGQLAGHWRQQFGLPVIGITGSNGKTTVTAMVRQMLSVSGHPLAPRDSFNNHWGVPLTLLELHPGHTHAVIEMGMNHPGEIDVLTRMTQPDVALINNATAAHLEGVGTVEEVARAKGEIINGLRANGTLVLNRDDPHYRYWRHRAGHLRVLTFGLHEAADITAGEVQCSQAGSQFAVRGLSRDLTVRLAVPGHHNVLNALATLTIGHAVGATTEDMAIGLATFSGLAGRLHRLSSSGGASLIDDSFNANPSSVRAAIDYLSQQPGRRILVLGAMAELGPTAEDLHAEVGSYARSAGIERLLVLGDSGNPALAGYRKGFGPKTEMFPDLHTLACSLRDADRPEVTLLIKGSKSARMERVVEAMIKGGLPGSMSC